MGRVFNALTPEDKEKINKYLEYYAGYEQVTSNESRASLEYILRYWDDAKDFLFDLFKGNLIIKKDFLYPISIDELAETIGDKISESNSEMNIFYTNYIEAIDNYCNNLTDAAEKDRIWWKLHDLISNDILARNEYIGTPFKVTTPQGHTISVTIGAKPSRILGKFAEAFNIEGYEAFRIEHSAILNKRKVAGKMCLSIHPLDYMTMSDNDYGWHSCMNWRDNGQYRIGTVEMMNSPYVIVAYIEGKEPFRFYDKTWNNKKWRNLVIVDNDILSCVKGYPYQDSSMDIFVLKWLSELYNEYIKEEHFDSNKIFNVSPEYNEFSIEYKENRELNVCFETDRMYNDFGNNNNTHCILSNSKIFGGSNIYINYSGSAECMYCGENWLREEDEATEYLIGNCCTQCILCENCGCRLTEEDIYYLDGEPMCEECYNDYATYDPIDDEYHHSRNGMVYYLAKTNDIKLDNSVYWLENFQSKIWLSNTHYDLNDYFTEYQSYKYRTNYVLPINLTEQGLKLFEDFGEEL